MRNAPATKVAYSIDEVIDVLGIGRRKIYELLNDGELKSYTIGRRRFVSVHALDEFIREREAASEPMRAAG